MIMRCIFYSLYTFIPGNHLCYALYAQALLSTSHQHVINFTSPLDLQVGKVGTGRGRKRKSGEQASTKDLQLAGILHIMFLLANDEVNTYATWVPVKYLRLYTTHFRTKLACHEVSTVP
jgi:hypothetical protein